jgi:hypothetical protein
VTLTSVLLQVLRGHTPVDATPYLTAAAVILAPSVMVIAAASLLLNVVLRDKYVAYAVSIALAIGLFYLYGQGRNLWWYNPLLIGLWTPTDLTDVWQNRVGVLVRRVYWLVIAVGCLGVAHRFYFRGVSRRTTE